MNVNEVIKELKNMKCGDVITILRDDMCPDYLTKTTWFSKIIFILGGNMSDVFVVGSYNEEDEIDYNAIMENLKKIIEKDIEVAEYNGFIDIAYTSEEVFREGLWGNFKSRIK